VRRRSDPAVDSVDELRSILSALQQYTAREPLQVDDAIKWIEAVGDRNTEDRVLQLAERLTFLLLVILPPAFAVLLIDGHLNVVLPDTVRIVLQVVGYLGLSTATSGGILIGERALKRRNTPPVGQ